MGKVIVLTLIAFHIRKAVVFRLHSLLGVWYNKPNSKGGIAMDDQLQIIQNSEHTYATIRQSIVQAQHKMSAAVNTAMVNAYWEIGEQIYKACGENDRA